MRCLAHQGRVRQAIDHPYKIYQLQLMKHVGHKPGKMGQVVDNHYGSVSSDDFVNGMVERLLQ